ncbi:hypothetical protein J3459_014724 [Metarhizium acridum]|nr:hypothetical protein J3459_014724 [Metarhizium acridum]
MGVFMTAAGMGATHPECWAYTDPGGKSSHCKRRAVIAAMASQSRNYTGHVGRRSVLSSWRRGQRKNAVYALASSKCGYLLLVAQSGEQPLESPRPPDTKPL